jgi:hypothetical protein
MELALECAVEGRLRFVADLECNLGDASSRRRERGRPGEQACLCFRKSMNVASHGLHEDNLGELGQHRARAVAPTATATSAENDALHSVVTLAKVDVRGCLAIDRAVKGVPIE